MSKKYHWFFNYEQKDYRIVSENFENAKQAMANLIGKTCEELSTPLVRDGKRIRGPLVRFDRVETEAGEVLYKAPTE